MGRGSGYGKTILIGDQFVLWGIPAILGAIPFQTDCQVDLLEHGRGWTLDDRREEVPGYKAAKKDDCEVAFNRMIRVMGLDLSSRTLNITLGGTLLAGSGVGASAALCVSFARACNEEFALGLDILQINHVAWQGEFGFHGLPSGLDNTVSAYGGIIKYRMEDHVKAFERVSLHSPVEIVLGNCGITNDTASLKGFLEEQEHRDPHLFNRRLDLIRTQVEDLGRALENGALKETGRIMNENHRILIEMGLSHTRLVEMCHMANSLGAYGSKVTGGGRGGYMVAFTPGRDLQEKVATAFEERGFSTVRAALGNLPTDPVKSQILI